MVIQTRLDVLRGKVGQDRAFLEIEAACTESATVMRGAISLLGKHENPKKLISIGEHLKNQFTDLTRCAHHELLLKVHEECQVYASPETLKLALVQVIHHFQADAGDEAPKLFIDVYSGDYEHSRFAVINISGAGNMSSDPGLWKMMHSLMQFQGGDFIIDTSGTLPQISLMLPIFRKRHSLYPIRSKADTNTALIVEDNNDVAESVSMTLHALGMTQVEIFNSPTEAITWLGRHTPSLVITDYSMLGMNGIEFLKQAESALASSTVVLMSGMPPEKFETELEELQIPVEVLMKPLKGNDLLHLVMRALH